MSGVKRYVVRGKTEDGAGGHFCAEVVLAYDYDRLEQECEQWHQLCAEAQAQRDQYQDQRDTALKQVEGLRELLAEAMQEVGPLELGTDLCGRINAALQEATQ